MKNKKKRLGRRQIILMICLLILGIFMVIPFYWSLMMSFTPKLLQEGSFTLWTGGFTLENWESLSQQNWLLYVFNTLFIAAMQIILSLFFSTLAAYAFAKFNFPGKKVLFKIMLLSMMVPGIITLLPQFIVVANLPTVSVNDVGPGLVNSLWGVILPQAVSIYGILFLRQFFVDSSNEIGEAARVDGAGELRIFWIYFRMAIPGITTLGLFTFISTWNSYLWPSMILFSESKITLGIALYNYQTTANTGEMMAASIFSIIPILILFIFTQKYFMNQTTYTGIK